MLIPKVVSFAEFSLTMKHFRSTFPGKDNRTYKILLNAILPEIFNKWWFEQNFAHLNELVICFPAIANKNPNVLPSDRPTSLLSNIIKRLKELLK